MLDCIIYVILWVVYTVALSEFCFYVCDLHSTPIFEIKSLGICFGLVLTIAGWIGFFIFVWSYLLFRC